MAQERQPQYRHLRDELKPGFVRGQWIAQRAGWVLMALFLLAAIVGLLGSGPLSRDTVSSSSDDVTVSAEYERWTRRKSPQELRVTVEAPNAQGDRLRLTINGDLLDSVELISVSPQPESTTFGADGQTYEWPVEDWSEPLTVSFDYEPQRWRRLTTDISVRAGDGAEQSLKIEQIVLP